MHTNSYYLYLREIGKVLKVPSPYGAKENVRLKNIIGIYWQSGTRTRSHWGKLFSFKLSYQQARPLAGMEHMWCCT